MINSQSLQNEVWSLPPVQCPRHTHELATNICLFNECPGFLQVLCCDCMRKHAGHEKYFQSLRKFLSSALLPEEGWQQENGQFTHYKSFRLELQQAVKNLELFLEKLQSDKQEIEQRIRNIKNIIRNLVKHSEKKTAEIQQKYQKKTSERLVAIIDCVNQGKQLLLEENLQILKSLCEISFSEESHQSCIKANRVTQEGNYYKNRFENIQKEIEQICARTQNVEKLCQASTLQIANFTVQSCSNISQESMLLASTDNPTQIHKCFKGEVAISAKVTSRIEDIYHMRELTQNEIIICGEQSSPLVLVDSRDLSVKQIIQCPVEMEVNLIYVENAFSFYVCSQKDIIVNFKRNRLKSDFCAVKKLRLYKKSVANIVQVNSSGDLAVLVNNEGIFLHKKGQMDSKNKKLIYETKQLLNRNSAHVLVERGILIGTFRQKICALDIQKKKKAENRILAALSFSNNKIVNSALLSKAAGSSNSVAVIALAHCNSTAGGKGNVEIYNLVKNQAQANLKFEILHNIEDPLNTQDKFFAYVHRISETEFIMPGVFLDGIQIWKLNLQKNEKQLENDQKQNTAQGLYAFEKIKELPEESVGQYNVIGQALTMQSKVLIFYGGMPNHKLYKIV